MKSSSSKAEDASADAEQSTVMTAYHDKLLGGSLSLASARMTGRSVRRMQSHKDVRDAGRQFDLDREEAAIDTLLARETERLHAASALAAVARRHGGKLPGGHPAVVAQAATTQADFQTLVRQELSVARGQAIVETEKRARRASVEMAEAAEAAARASIADSLRTGRPFTSQSAGRSSRRGSAGGGPTGGSPSGRRGSAASVPESVISILEGGGGGLGDDLRMDLSSGGGGGDGRPATAVSSVAGRPYSGTRHRTVEELRALGAYGVVDPLVGRADPLVYAAGDAAAARPTTPGMALAMLQGSHAHSSAANASVPHLLVVNLGVSKRRAFKEFARTHALRVSVATTVRSAVELVCDRTNSITAVLADITEGAAAVHDLQVR